MASKQFRFAKLSEEEADERLATHSAQASIVAAAMSGAPVPAQLEPAQDLAVRLATKSGRYLLDVPTDEITLNRHNARKLPPVASELDKLSASLLEKQDTPLAGYLDKQGRVCLIDGHRRLAAAKNAGIATLRVEIQPEPATERELYRASRSYNVERASQGFLDDAIAWKQMLEKGVYRTQTEIAEDSGFEESVVSRIINLASLPARIIELLNGQDKLNNLRMLSAIRLYCDECGEEAAKALIISAEDSGLSSREVDSLRKSFSKEKVTRVRSDTRSQLHFTKGNAVVKQFDSARKIVIEIDSVEDGLSLSEIYEKIRATMTAALGGEKAP